MCITGTKTVASDYCFAMDDLQYEVSTYESELLRGRPTVDEIDTLLELKNAELTGDHSFYYFSCSILLQILPYLKRTNSVSIFISVYLGEKCKILYKSKHAKKITLII